MNDFARESLLYDFYGGLLTKRKREVMELYHEEDLSLSEIASQFNISRAAVHDSLKSGEKQLEKYEEELGLVARFSESEKAHSRIKAIIEKLQSDYKSAVSLEGFEPELKLGFCEILDILNHLEGE